MAGGEHADLWTARIQEQLEGLARARKVSLHTGDPVPVNAEIEGTTNIIGKAFSSGETITIQFSYTINLDD